MGKSIIVIPPYYRGTSFEDIANSLLTASRKIDVPILFLGAAKAINNKLSSEKYLDDSLYIKGQLKILNELSRELKKIDRILFLDFFNPGLDLIKYAITQNSRRIKIGSLLHGGSFIPGDLYSDPWLKNFECGWFDINEIVYTPSKYAASVCPKEFKNKIKIFPWGMDSFVSINNPNKIFEVIFPHRLQSDKGTGDLIEIVKQMPEVNFLITSPQTKNILTKNPYYKKLIIYKNVTFRYVVTNDNIANFLSKSKVVLSCSAQETFGYSIMKAVACGCTPVVPDKTVYVENIDKKFRYTSIKSAVKLIDKYVHYTKKSNARELKQEFSSYSFEPLLKDFFK
jgi:glycosyltransferase involved in cell wall biosynthesis